MSGVLDLRATSTHLYPGARLVVVDGVPEAPARLRITFDDDDAEGELLVRDDGAPGGMTRVVVRRCRGRR